LGELGGITLDKTFSNLYFLPLLIGVSIIIISFIIFVLLRFDILTFVGFLGLGITLISWYFNLAKILKKTLHEFIIEILNKYELNDDEKNILDRVMKEPITLLEIESDAMVINAIDSLVDKNVINKKSIRQSDGGFIYLYYFSPISFRFLTPFKREIPKR
jgi:predicted transcriptional regulator